jgi:26S proteasome regulatory subunit N6
MAETFAEQLTKKLNEANEAEEAEQTGNAIKIYELIIKEAAKESDDLTEEAIKTKETATYKLANIYKEKGLVNELIELQKSVLPLFIDFPKSKTAKIMRTLFDLTLKLEGHYQELIELCKFIIQWCESESRSFLRMRIETNLADLYFKIEKYQDAIQILNKLTYELKKKEDKQLLVESQLVESKVYHALENIPKAKASLTAVKTICNQIYIVPLLQAEIDMMSGLIAADDKDYTTAYSYFYETFEGYRSMNETTLAGNAFKFMLFSKIMNRQSEDSLALINSAISLKY